MPPRKAHLKSLIIQAISALYLSTSIPSVSDIFCLNLSMPTLCARIAKLPFVAGLINHCATILAYRYGIRFHNLSFKLFIKWQYRPFEILTEQRIGNNLRTFAIKAYTLSVHEVCAHTANELIRAYSLLRRHLYQATHRRSDGFVVMSL